MTPRFATLAVPLALLAVACSNITPTKTVDLCQGDSWSRNCAACTGKQANPHCEQCKGSSPAAACKNADAGPTATGGATGGSGSGSGNGGKGGASGSSGTGGGGTSGGGAGSGGAGGTGGSAMDAGKDAGPCGMKCPTDKPVCVAGSCEECGDDGDCQKANLTRCEPTTHTCVQCLGKTDCSSGTPECDTSAGVNACVECVQSTDCTDTTKPVCADHACVACTENADCKDPTQPECKAHTCGACTGDAACTDRNATPHCDTTSSSASKGQCVQCLANGDCANPTPQCNATRTCVACTSNAACTGRTNATICDLSSDAAYGGTCVQCTVSAETPCAGDVCVPNTRACAVGHPKNSKGTCEVCLADTECVTNNRCIPMQYMGADRPGAYCLKQLSSTCEQPYMSAPINRVSVSGATAEDYCGISESKTSCEAVRGLIANATCPTGNDSECTGDGAICRTVNGGLKHCTYACTASAECPSIFACQSNYCGGPP